MDRTKTDIENLITRSLDTKLSDDEQLRLDRELIRNPDARRLIEEYRRIDQMAAIVLRDALKTEDLPLDPEDLPLRVVDDRKRRTFHRWWLAWGSIAAALLAIAVARFPAILHDEPGVKRIVPRTAESRLPSGTSMRPQGAPRVSMRNATYTRASLEIKRDTGRDVLGIIGDDGNVYWIEVDRIRTLKSPRDALGRSRTTDTM